MRRGGVICAGNWIVDIVHSIDRWPAKSDLVFIQSEAEGVGGGAANVVIDLAAFDTGLPLQAVGLIGRDRHGETLRAACTAAGVTAAFQEAEATTAHTHVMNVPGDSRTFFYHGGTNDLFGPEHVPMARLAASGARIFYLGYLNLLARLDRIGPDGRSGAAEVLAAARAAGMLTCVDLVSKDGPSFRPTVEATLPEIDYLFLNELEAARATGLAVTGPGDVAGLTAAARQLLQGGVACAVIIHSAELGLWVGAGGQVVQVAPAPVQPDHITSPVGAGDAFCAGVLLGLHEGWPPELALELGHRAAAASLASPTATGSIPPLAVLMPDHPPLLG